MTTKHTSDYIAVVRERTHTGLGPMAQNQGFLSNEVIIFITAYKMQVGAGACCGAHLSPLSVTHALCVENANCEEEKLK